MNKILIIITRIDGTEFSKYWKFNKDDLSKIIKIGNDSVLFVNGLFIGKNNKEYVSSLIDITSKSELNFTGNEIGLISHQGPDPFPIDSWGSKINFVFNKKYSSTYLGKHFCESQNDDFVSLAIKPTSPRTGVLDGFRDATVFEGYNIENHSEPLNNLWNYFKGNRKLNSALDFLHNCLGNNIDKTILTNAGFDLNISENNKPSLEQLIQEFQKEFKIPALKDLRDALLEIAVREK